MATLTLLGTLVTLVLAYIVHKYILKPEYYSTLRNLPGPPSPNFILGWTREIFSKGPGELHTVWTEKYGKAYRYRGIFAKNQLYISDPAALNYILATRAYDYVRPKQFRENLAKIIGKGILFAEGDAHKRQRRLLSPAFTQASTNAYQPVFQEQANKLRDHIGQELDRLQEGGKTVKDGWIVLDVNPLIARATLDIIGLVGFAYEFGAQDNATESKLAEAFNQLSQPFKMSWAVLFMFALSILLPGLPRPRLRQGKIRDAAQKVLDDEARSLMKIRKEWQEANDLEDKNDLLSQLFKHNLKTSNASEAMSEEELRGQIMTLIFAGHETSAVTLVWAMYYLSMHPDMQSKLRDELKAARSEAIEAGQMEISGEVLGSLPYLDGVIRETLRLVPPAFLTLRGADKEDFIPLSKPIKGIDGKAITSLHVQKDQAIVVGIGDFNLDIDIFGKDAKEFNPGRWIDRETLGDLDAAKGFTAWHPIMSFLGGPRGCIGYRVALAEIKTILATIVLAFEFLERDEGGTRFLRRSNMVARPVVADEEEAGVQLPLRMRRI